MKKITTYRQYLVKEGQAPPDLYGDASMPYQYNSNTVFTLKYHSFDQLKDVQQKKNSKVKGVPKKIAPYQTIEAVDIETGKTYTGRFLKGDTLGNGDYETITMIDQDESVRTLKPKSINII